MVFKRPGMRIFFAALLALLLVNALSVLNNKQQNQQQQAASEQATIVPQNCSPTAEDLLGPFYKPDAPFTTNLAPNNAPGTPLTLKGIVVESDCTTPVIDTVIELWQADSSGHYHDNAYRARVRTDANGQFSFTTVKPAAYETGDTFRPAHIHIRIDDPAYESLTTQLYIADNKNFTTDPIRTIIPQGKTDGNKTVLQGVFYLVLKKN